jgi:hypothetical protein
MAVTLVVSRGAEMILKVARLGSSGATTLLKWWRNHTFEIDIMTRRKSVQKT